MKRKHVVLIVLALFWSLATSAQNQEVKGEYKYATNRYYESIILIPNGTFKWEMKCEFINLQIHGNWQLRNDTLILDSYPQRDRLIVWESSIKKRPGRQVVVRDKNNGLLNFNLVGIGNNSDTINIPNQIDKTSIPDSINSFYILDSKGMVSPVYKIKGSRTNFFKVYFETIRVFENEKWPFKNGLITPKGLNGSLQRYVLSKTSL